MDISLAQILKVYGPLGALAVIGIGAAVHMFRVLTRERREHTERLAQLQTEHKAEMQTMVDRYIETTSTTHEKYHGLAERLHALVESLSRKIDRRSS